MKTLTLNTYDAAARFDMSDEQAAKFFDHVEKLALASGYYGVSRVIKTSVDEESENFVTRCFENYSV